MTAYFWYNHILQLLTGKDPASTNTLSLTVKFDILKEGQVRNYHETTWLYPCVQEAAEYAGGIIIWEYGDKLREQCLH